MLLERIGILRLSHADTESVRFISFDEVKESKCAHNRAQQESFLYENKVALEKLPVNELFDSWIQSHLLSPKKNDIRYDGKSQSVETFFKKDTTSLKFMET